uniref:Uncharacterized protein n=1 Tax=Meloidogyne hapla TaxID=6305 RepID=A0A1I8B3T1_MELHA
MHHFDGNPQEGSLVNHGTIGLNTLTSNQYIFLHQNYNTNFLPSHFGYQNNELNEYLENNHPSNAYSHTSGPYHYTSEHEPFHNPTISNDNMNQNELWKGNKQVQGRGNYVPWNNFNESSASDGNEYDNELWKLYKSSDKMK